MTQIKFFQMFQMLEETEEALPLIAIFINQNIVRQVQVASTGHSSESQAENIVFYSILFVPTFGENLATLRGFVGKISSLDI